MLSVVAKLVYAASAAVVTPRWAVGGASVAVIVTLAMLLSAVLLPPFASPVANLARLAIDAAAAFVALCALLFAAVPSLGQSLPAGSVGDWVVGLLPPGGAVLSALAAVVVAGWAPCCVKAAGARARAAIAAAEQSTDYYRAVAQGVTGHGHSASVASSKAGSIAALSRALE